MVASDFRSHRFDTHLKYFLLTKIDEMNIEEKEAEIGASENDPVAATKSDR